MSAFLLTEEGDFDLVNGSMALTANETTPGQEVLQSIRSNLRFFQGEYFLDETVGIPYWQTIFKKGVPLSVIEGIFRQAILDTDGVLQLNSFTMTLNNTTRRATITFSVQAVTGPITATETI